MSAFLDIAERIQLIKDKIKKDARSEGTVEPSTLPPPGTVAPLHQAEVVVTAPPPASASSANRGAATAPSARAEPVVRFQDQSSAAPVEDLSGVDPLQVSEVLMLFICSLRIRFFSNCLLADLLVDGRGKGGLFKGKVVMRTS
jgi:hypothetical protein